MGNAFFNCQSSVAKPQKPSSTTNMTRSLNILVRKRENERIERENHALAKRLFDKQSQISKKKFDNEFGHHLKYKH
jgi:deoxyhypusine synthase